MSLVPKYPTTSEACVAAFHEDLKRRMISLKSEKEYMWTLRALVDVLGMYGKHTLPYEIDELDIKWLNEIYYTNRRYTIKTRKHYNLVLKLYTEFFGNTIMWRMRIRYAHDNRPNVDWLSREQVDLLLDVWKTPVQELTIHFMLCLGLRRVEVIRLRVRDITPSQIYVNGKGPIGGKPRYMPHHPDTPYVLERYLSYREELIKDAREAAKGQPVSVPEELLIWQHGAKLYPFSEKGSGLDKAVKDDLSRRLSFKVRNHTLRRTFGREMHLQGAPIEIISVMLGHESVSQTQKYLGLDVKDVEAYMRQSTLRRK